MRKKIKSNCPGCREGLEVIEDTHVDETGMFHSTCREVLRQAQRELEDKERKLFARESAKAAGKQPKPGKPHCPKCGFRIRGSKKNHEEGPHHLLSDGHGHASVGEGY